MGCLRLDCLHRSFGQDRPHVPFSSQRGVEGNESAQARFFKREKEVQALDSSLHAREHDQDMLRVDKAHLDDERSELVRHRTQIELDLKALTEDQEHMRAAKLRYERELAELTAAIAEHERELATLVPDYNRRRDEEQHLVHELADADATRQRLYAKQGHNTQFRSKKERDD